jgi:hypothetical protein
VAACVPEIDTDTDTDTFSDTDSDTAPQTVNQEPITFDIQNNTDEAVYLNGDRLLSAEFYNSGEWTPIDPVQPWCSLTCDEVTEPFNCCMDCDMSINTLVILPGDTVTYTWDGSVYSWDKEVCDCGCYRSVNPFVGDYTFAVAAYSGADCYTPEGCSLPEKSGFVYDRMVTGPLNRVETKLSIPYAGEHPVLAIGRDTSCDDGTVPTCKMLPPDCDSASEVLAYQNDCYRCVNPDTCKPWGEPGCESEADCEDGEVCSDCGSSSCPICDDCIKACRTLI